MNRRWQRAQWVLAPAILLAAGFALWRQVGSLSLEQLRAAWAATPSPRIAWSLLGTALSFGCLAAYEWFATARTVPGRVPAREALRVGAMAHAISNTLGFHALTGSAFRYQQYRYLGLGVTDVARLIAVVALCVGAGVVLVSGGALVWLQLETTDSNRAIATAVVVTGFALVIATHALRKERPGLRSLVSGHLASGDLGALLVIAALEMTAAIGALYVLLPAELLPGVAQFILIFVSAMLLGIVSHAPGGIGVFEATVLAALPAGRSADVLVALLLYRAIYNLLPFLLAAIALALQPLRSATLRNL